MCKKEINWEHTSRWYQNPITTSQRDAGHFELFGKKRRGLTVIGTAHNGVFRLHFSMNYSSNRFSTGHGDSEDKVPRFMCGPLPVCVSID